VGTIYYGVIVHSRSSFESSSGIEGESHICLDEGGNAGGGLAGII